MSGSQHHDKQQRAFHFDRFRRGNVMAQGIVVHAANLEEATTKAERMADRGDELRLRHEPAPLTADDAEFGMSEHRVDAEPPQPSLYDRGREETMKLAREVLRCAIPDGEGRQGILWAKRFANELLSAPSHVMPTMDAVKLLDEGFSIKVLNPEKGNYWRCPHCDKTDSEGHGESCLIRRLVALIPVAASATATSEIIEKCYRIAVERPAKDMPHQISGNQSEDYSCGYADACCDVATEINRLRTTDGKAKDAP